MTADLGRQLFEQTVGLESLSSDWRYAKVTSAQVTKRLDNAIELRSQIAHRDKNLTYVYKKTAVEFGELVIRLADITDDVVNQHVKKHIGRLLFEKPSEDQRQKSFEELADGFD